MREDLLAERPAEGVHATARGDERRARIHERAYRWVSALPIRTLVLIMLGAYAVLTAAVVLGSPFDAIDHAAAAANFAHHYPTASRWLLQYVIVGQRGPSSCQWSRPYQRPAAGRVQSKSRRPTLKYR